MKKIKDYKKEICVNPEHDPPKHIVLEPGEYEHECPACHKKQYIKVPLILL